MLFATFLQCLLIEKAVDKRRIRNRTPVRLTEPTEAVPGNPSIDGITQNPGKQDQAREPPPAAPQSAGDAQGALTFNEGGVILDEDEAAATTFHAHRDPRCRGIYGIFDQFLDRGGGAFDDLTCGNSVDDRFRQAADGDSGQDRLPE